MNESLLQGRVDAYFVQLDRIVKSRSTSSRVRFMIQDLIDLRLNGWVPRRADNNPKTIDQIHKEAQNEEQQRQVVILDYLILFKFRIPSYTCNDLKCLCFST